MKKGKCQYLFLFLILSFGVYTSLIAQQEQLEIEGAIRLQNSTEPNPAPGTIRWTGKNFEGWNGFAWIPFTAFVVADVITDLDGNQYRTVQIGSQEWMAENLRVTQDQNEVPLIEIMDNNGWVTNMDGKYCWYSDMEATYKHPYGAYYDWITASGNFVGGSPICPTGWRLPDNTDWTILQISLGGNLVAGGPLKEQGEAHWNTTNIGASNSSGFTAVGGGWRSNSGSFGFFGDNTYFWSETKDASDQPFIWSITKGSTQLFNNPLADTNFGLSVRCIKI